MSAFPPQKTLTSLPVSQETALKFLTSYLTATKTTPHLLPNARLEPSGPTAGSSSSSVTIHNLERVQAGLRGEWLAPILDLQEEGVQVAMGLEGNGEGDKMEVDGWQDLGEYQREQSFEEGEVGPRQVGVVQEGDSEFEGRLEVEDAGDEVQHAALKSKAVKKKYESGMDGAKISKPVDKEAKKKAKKLKLKEEKKKRRAQLQAEDVAE